MRRLYPLTPEEQEFAAIHIDLVDTFLRRVRLDPDEYYDIVIFGYLEAVQKQHREPIEEERQNFNALAKICMRHAVGEDWKYRLKEKRKGDLLNLSLDHLDTCTENDEFSFLDFIPDIVKQLIDDGKSVPEIGKQLGMKPEEIFRLSDFSRDDFLEMMTKGVQGYSKAVIYKKV